MKGLRQKIHLGLMGKGRLGNTKPPHGARKGIVGVHTMAFNIHVIHFIGTGGMDRCSGRNRQAVGAIGPCVADHAGGHGHEMTVFVRPGFEDHLEGVALGGHAKAFFPGEHADHRPFKIIEGQTDKPLNIQVQLGAEPPTRGRLNNADPIFRHPQQGNHLAVIVMGVLGGRDNHQLPVRCHVPGARVRFQIGMLQKGGLIGFFHHHGTLFKGFSGISLFDFSGKEQVSLFVNFWRIRFQGFFRVMNGWEIFVGDANFV